MLREVLDEPAVIPNHSQKGAKFLQGGWRFEVHDTLNLGFVDLHLTIPYDMAQQLYL